jgi:hypothetical protein
MLTQLRVAFGDTQMKTLPQIEKEIAGNHRRAERQLLVERSTADAIEPGPLDYAADAKPLCGILNDRAVAILEQDRV